MTKLGKIGELNQDIWVYIDRRDIKLPAGTIVELLNEYYDQGYWSDGDPYHVESPFKAYVIRLDGVEYGAVHTKVVKLID